jgi:hypothetical protein
MAIGGFQLLRVSEPFTGYTYSGTTPYSVKNDLSYSSHYGSLMGKIWVSCGIESVRFDVCAESGDTLLGGPQFRIWNRTDTNATETEVVATQWVDIDSTDPKWYGPGNEEKLTLAITKSTTIKEVNLDIQVRNLNDNSTNTPFLFYAVLCYEYMDER